MAPLCILAKRGTVRANCLPLSNDLEAWPDISVGRALGARSQGSRVRIPLGSVIFSHFHFSNLNCLISSSNRDINGPAFPQGQRSPTCRVILVSR